MQKNKRERGRVLIWSGSTARSRIRTVTLGEHPSVGVCTVGGERVTVVRRRFLDGPQYVPGVGVTSWSAWSIKS